MRQICVPRASRFSKSLLGRWQLYYSCRLCHDIRAAVSLSTLALVSRSFSRVQPELSDCEPQIGALPFLPLLEFYVLDICSFNVGHYVQYVKDAAACARRCCVQHNRYYFRLES